MKGSFNKVNTHIGAGNIDIKYLKKPVSGSLNIKIGTGSATASFPKDSKLSVSQKSSIGSISNVFSKEKKSDYFVTMKAGVGSLNIIKY